MFFSTASSFRAAIPPGDVTVEAFHAALPYPNRVATAEMTGSQILTLLGLSRSKAGSDGFAQQSGLRYRVSEGLPVEVRILEDPADPASGHVPVDPDAVYRVGSTDFMAFVAAGYKELFGAASKLTRTEQDVHALLARALAAGSVPALRDGRSGDPER